MTALKYISLLFITFLIFTITCENESEPSTQPGDPALAVSPASLQLTGSPMFDVITIYNQGGGVVSWNITASPLWLTVEPTSGTVTNDSVFVRLTTEFDALDYGDYQGNVTVQSNAGAADIVISLSYSPPELNLNTTLLNLDRHYSYGDLIIENVGGGGLEWKITDLPEWLEFDALSDIVYGRPQEVPFRVNFADVAYGEYDDTVRIESNGGTAEILVYLTYFREEEVYPGVGAANIALGDAYNRVKKIWGNPDRNWYERPEKTVFIHYFIYNDLGLLFSVQNSSPVLYGTGPVGYIKLIPPYDGLTVEKRIGIGSTLAELLAAYGDPTSIDNKTYYYDIGIAFEIENDMVYAMIIE